MVTQNSPQLVLTLIGSGVAIYALSNTKFQKDIIGHTGCHTIISVKLNLYLNAKRFFIAFSHVISVFEVMSMYPIDQNQKAIPKEMPLHELKKTKSTSKAFHAHDP